MGMSMDQGFGKANMSGVKMVHNLEAVLQERRLRDNLEEVKDYIFGRSDVNPNQDLVDRMDNIEAEIEVYTHNVSEEVKADIRKQKINR